MLNSWYRVFYDLMQNVAQHRLAEFEACLIKFMWIAIPYCMLATLTSYFTRLYSLRWREAITFDYIPRWRNVKDDIEGASQRIQEDTYRFARIIESLGVQVAEAAMTLAAFVPILWMLSQYVEIPLIQGTVHQFVEQETHKIFINNNFIPGSLVWIALIVSVGGMVASWFIGGKLPGLEYNNQKVEAAYRKELVFGEEDKVNHASLKTLAELFTGIKYNYHRLFLHYGYFDIWRTLFNQFMVIVPYIIMGPGLFTGLVTLGLLQQVSNSFDQVRGSLSLFINNWTTITELRSINKRLREFEQNLDKHRVKEEKKSEVEK